MITGCSPIDDEPPTGHCFVHYPRASKKFGLICLYWLFGFERVNKKLKGLVGNSTHPLASLMKALTLDAGHF